MVWGKYCRTELLYIKKLIRAEAAETDGEVPRVVRETLWHEIGHHF
jgi:predicted Zn-dependent protease with MMP-like domain